MLSWYILSFAMGFVDVQTFIRLVPAPLFFLFPPVPSVIPFFIFIAPDILQSLDRNLLDKKTSYHAQDFP